MKESEKADHRCAYNHYDLNTLKASNFSSHLRLAELGWTRNDFDGLTVLDIGSNSGHLSIIAKHLGARTVTAIEADPVSFDFFSAVIEKHNLQISLSQRAFNDLSTLTDSADVILFMEVLHWAVSQGTPIRDVLQKLALLTRKTLFIEFPWSISEPSIQSQTSLTESEYNAQTVLEELTRYFREVRVVRYMKYFGHKSASVRALVRADQPRATAKAIMAFQDANILDEVLDTGRGSAAIINSSSGLFIAKTLAHDTVLHALPDETINQIFDALQGATTIVPPIKIKGDYRQKGNEQIYVMVYPFISSEGLHHEFRYPSHRELINICCGIQRDLKALDPLKESIQNLFSSTAHLSWGTLLENLNLDIVSGDRKNKITQIQMPHFSSTRLDTICHLDIHATNIIKLEDGSSRVVDLDNLAMGTPYTDAMVALLRFGGQIRDFSYLQIELAIDRPPDTFDCFLSLAILLEWYRQSAAINWRAEEKEFEFMQRGIDGMIEFMSSL